jgi:quinoprotein glucose dehydrogenase
MPSRSSITTAAAFFLLSIAVVRAPAADEIAHGDGVIVGEPAKDAIAAIKSFKTDPGMKIDLFASEPLLKNPVAFTQDELGRWFIAESYRQEKGIEDNRGHAAWLNDDIAAQTIEDRLAMIHKYYPDPAKFAERFAKEEERIVRIEDTKGAGVADKATVFADGFRDPLDGSGAGLIARGKELWWTCIPNLWRFVDNDGDGKADVKDKMLTGFGVKFALRGHDMHGLRFGPDGKLYFSIGDRAINVTSKEGKKFPFTESGSIMRCNPDGTAFEVYATGVRNPQELAFNELGDLFTGDNNSDGGDMARFTQLVEGGDCGWRMSYQYLNDRGPWMRERPWDEKIAPSVKYIIPCIANISNGPSGLTYNPGTGLSPKYNRHFFLSDFRGGASASVVHDIELEQQGAWYKKKQVHDFVKGILTTDVEFGVDGGLYVLDWVEGWSGANKGRIYKFTDQSADTTLQRDTQKIIAEGMSKRSVDELVTLLAHADMRVRQAAQFELAAKGPAAAAALTKAAQAGPNRLARLHAIWGLGQVAEKDANAVSPLIPVLGDEDAEVRAQSAKVLGDRKVAAAGDKLVALLKDPSARARYHAALALGKIGHAPAVDPLCAMLAENNDQDPILRHGGVMGLAGCAKPEQLAAKAADGNVAVRVGAVVALRHVASPQIAVFLKDADEGVVLEAARAINDVPINDSMPALADVLANKAIKNPRILERAVNAAYRLGGADRANALAAFANDSAVPEASRKEAIDALGDWGDPDPKDRILNLWRPIAKRGSEAAVAAVSPIIPALLGSGASVQEATAQVAAKLGLKPAGEQLAALAMNDKAGAGPRIAALKALVSFKDARLADAAKSALAAKDAKLRSEGLQALAGVEPASAVKIIAETIEKGALPERQGGIAALVQINSAESKAQLAALMEKLIAGQCAPEIQLDVYEAAKKAGLGDLVGKWKNSLPANDDLANFKLSLAGGDVERGRKLFREKPETSCLRCHKCEIGDSQVGPELTHIAATKDRLYLLESIVYPNRKISEGFQTVSLELKDKNFVVGRLVGEDAQNLRLETMDETGKVKPVIVPVADIAQRISAPSPMPENLRDMLSRTELRDVIEYLATRK